MMGSKTIVFVLLAFTAMGSVAFADSISSSTMTNTEDEIPTARRWSGEWNFEVGGGNYDEGKDEGVLSYLYLRSKFQYRFTRWMKAIAAPRLDLYASRVQERFDDNDSGSGSLRFSEAYLSLTPIDWFEFRAGAIGQKFLSNAMLVSGRKAFPGAQEILSKDMGFATFEFDAQQAVPTSYSLNSERVDKEALPSFQTQSLQVHSGIGDWMSGTVTGGHFEWRDLPSKVAFESAITGNNVNGELAPGASFKYGFAGLFWSSEFVFGPIQYPQMIVEFEGLNNQKAPGNAGRAELWGIGPRFKVGEIECDLRYRRYYIESDASVSYYNFYRMGNNNRFGDNIDVRIDFKKLKFAVVLDWYNTRTINNNPNQFTLNSYYLGVETHYATF